MCGRFTLSANRQRLKDFFPLYEIPDTVPRFNIAPTQQILAIVSKPWKLAPRKRPARVQSR